MRRDKAALSCTRPRSAKLIITFPDAAQLRIRYRPGCTPGPFVMQEAGGNRCIRLPPVRAGMQRRRQDRGSAIMRYVVSAVAALVMALSPAAGQNWPNRPVKFIVTQAAGSTPDIIARMVADKLGQALGQQVIVENRVGGANAIGAGVVARAATRSFRRRRRRSSPIPTPSRHCPTTPRRTSRRCR